MTGPRLDVMGLRLSIAVALVFFATQLAIDAGLVDSRSREKSLDAALGQIQDLHRIGTELDVAGVPRGWVPRSLTRAIEVQTEVLRDLGLVIRRQTALLERMEMAARLTHPP